MPLDVHVHKVEQLRTSDNIVHLICNGCEQAWQVADTYEFLTPEQLQWAMARLNGVCMN